MNYKERKVRDLENATAVAASAVENETVTVKLSEPLAWLIRDWIGFGGLRDILPGVAMYKPSFTEDMHRLNAALGARTPDESSSVSRWSSDTVRALKERFRAL